MPSEKRKARKQNYFKAAKQSRKVQEVSPRKNIIGNKGVLKQQKGKPLLAMQCLKTIIYINVLKQRA